MIDCCRLETGDDKDRYLNACFEEQVAAQTSFVAPDAESGKQCMQTGTQRTNYINADGEIVHFEESEADDKVVDNSVCCALYDPEDTSTYGMREACETLETEIEGAEVEVFFE